VKFSGGIPFAYILAMYAFVFAGLPTTTTYASILTLVADHKRTILSFGSSLKIYQVQQILQMKTFLE